MKFLRYSLDPLKYIERWGINRQPYQHHTAIGSTGIYSYSFALNPEQHQPSGTVNMSRIDNATLLLNTTTSTNSFKLRVYAINYNVLRKNAQKSKNAFASELKNLRQIQIAGNSYWKIRSE